jgi:hypothetical protein
VLRLYNESWGIPLAIAKPLTEASIFLFSYWVQKKSYMLDIRARVKRLPEMVRRFSFVNLVDLS